MNQWKRLLFYVVLNILVSACTTLAVMYFWDRQNHSSAPILPSLAFFTSGTPTAIPTPTIQVAPSEAAPKPTLPSTGELPRLIVIDNIFGVGNLNDEILLLKRVGEGELTLTNWRLDDGGGNSFTFPDLMLYPGGAVQVHTAPGTNSAVDLYWGHDAAVWQIGKVATLYDDQGNVRATYRVP